MCDVCFQEFLKFSREEVFAHPSRASKGNASIKFPEPVELSWAAPSVHLSGLMRTPAYGSSKYASAPYHGVAWPVVQKDAKKSTEVDASQTHSVPMPVQPSQSEEGLRAQGCSIPRYRESAGPLTTTPSDS